MVKYPWTLLSMRLTSEQNSRILGVCTILTVRGTWDPSVDCIKSTTFAKSLAKHLR